MHQSIQEANELAKILFPSDPTDLSGSSDAGSTSTIQAKEELARSLSRLQDRYEYHIESHNILTQDEIRAAASAKPLSELFAL